MTDDQARMAQRWRDRIAEDEEYLVWWTEGRIRMRSNNEDISARVIADIEATIAQHKALVARIENADPEAGS
jgi:hypothetical protein